MLGHEDRTAILKRLDRSLIGVYLLRNIHDLHLIKPDQRSVDRQFTHFIGRHQAVHCLRSHLADTLAGDQAQTLRLPGDPLRNAHHIPAHDDRQLIMRTFVVNIQLYIRKIDDMEIYRARIGRHLGCQIHHFLFRPLTGVRRCMKIYRIDLDTPLRDHPSGHRRINATGQKQHSLAARAYRHATRPRNDLGININLISYFHIQKDVRLVHIHMHLRISLQNGASQFHIDLHGIERVILSGTSGRNLKALMPIRINRANIIHDRLLQLIEPFIFHIDHRTDPGYSEYFLQMRHSLLIVKLRDRIHIDTSVRLAHGKFTFAFLQSVLDLLHQRIFKQISVLSLHTDLSIFYQKSCKHISSWPSTEY